MEVPQVEIVDVERDGRWCQVLLLEVSSAQTAVAGAALLGARGGAAYVGVVSTDVGPELPEVLAALRPGLQEIVCFDSIAEPGSTGSDLAFRALDELGFGQDFVYTVPALEDAVEHAVATLLDPGRHGWEGEFVVVLGPREVAERARAGLATSGR